MSGIFFRGVRKVALALAPKAWRLPLKYRFYLAGGEAAELSWLDKLGPNAGVAIDVGANEGLYAYRLSQLYEKVYAFEINPELTCDLKALGAGNIDVANVGLSSEKKQLKLFIPVVNGRPLTGWASLTPGNCPDTNEHIEKTVEVVRLDDLNVGRVQFIKIDVEGHEFEVLKGAAETIQRNRPHSLVEVKEANRVAVFGFFDKLGYTRRPLSEIIEQAGTKDDFVFAPQ